MDVFQIYGTSRSGSTILGLLLGSHPQCRSLGEWINYCTDVVGLEWDWPELQRLREHPDRQPASRSACSSCGASCSVWPTSMGQAPLREHYQWVQEQHPDHPSILVDTSKTPWFFDKLNEHGTHRPVPILIYKHPHAYLHSVSRVLRKLPEQLTDNEIRTHLGAWRQYHQSLLENQPTGLVAISYDELCLFAIPTLEQAIHGSDMSFHSDMLRPGEVAHHQIAGNPGVQRQQADRALVLQRDRQVIPETLQHRIAKIDEEAPTREVLEVLSAFGQEP